MHHVLASAALPWASTPSPSPSTSSGPNPDTVGPGLLGFVFFVFLLIAVVLIGRGLSKQLKRVDFDEDTATANMLGDRAPAPVPDEGVDLGGGDDADESPKD